MKLKIIISITLCLMENVNRSICQKTKYFASRGVKMLCFAIHSAGHYSAVFFYFVLIYSLYFLCFLFYFIFFSSVISGTF